MSGPDFMFKDNSAPADFGRRFVASEAFRALFREGMALVEDTAAYLDGPGREESRRVPRQIGLAYASESMRLTTRLMQIASWLLVQRALAEGEISPNQALAERNRVRLGAQETPTPLDDFEALPHTLKDLVALSLRLHARILHLDRLIDEKAKAEPPAESLVARQHQLLQLAFGKRSA
jgi:regulator of CtrA degradation